MFKYEHRYINYLKYLLGTLSFALNNEFMGVAFKDVGLTKGPIFAAVALLHCAGCTIVTGKPVPSYMINVWEIIEEFLF